MLCASVACSPPVRSGERSPLARCRDTIVLKPAILRSTFPTTDTHIVVKGASRQSLGA